MHALAADVVAEQLHLIVELAVAQVVGFVDERQYWAAEAGADRFAGNALVVEQLDQAAFAVGQAVDTAQPTERAAGNALAADQRARAANSVLVAELMQRADVTAADTDLLEDLEQLAAVLAVEQVAGTEVAGDQRRRTAVLAVEEVAGAEVAGDQRLRAAAVLVAEEVAGAELVGGQG